jgi:hypothetical protein
MNSDVTQGRNRTWKRSNVIARLVVHDEPASSSVQGGHGDCYFLVWFVPPVLLPPLREGILVAPLLVSNLGSDATVTANLDDFLLIEGQDTWFRTLLF